MPEMLKEILQGVHRLMLRGTGGTPPNQRAQIRLGICWAEVFGLLFGSESQEVFQKKSIGADGAGRVPPGLHVVLQALDHDFYAHYKGSQGKNPVYKRL